MNKPLAVPRLQLIINDIMDILQKSGPLSRYDITKKMARKYNIPTQCNCCYGTHNRYEELVTDTIDGLMNLRNQGKVKWDKSGWDIT